jgi:hypothetical protein
MAKVPARYTDKSVDELRQMLRRAASPQEQDEIAKALCHQRRRELIDKANAAPVYENDSLWEKLKHFWNWF